MTNDDKAELRRLIRRGDRRSDFDLALLCDCSPSTVRKYRKVLAPDPAKAPQ